jgi:hypothetical protein
MKNIINRRSFMKSTAIASTALLGAGTTTAWASPSAGREDQKEEFPFFRGSCFDPKNGVAGLLFSQIGYEVDYPVRIIIRLPGKDHLPEGASCRLVSVERGSSRTVPCKYWDALWGSHWWVAEFTGMWDPGEYNVEIYSEGTCVFRDNGLKVAKNILLDNTVELAAADMLERRVHFTKVGAGWQDAGTLWVESPAQSAMVIALEELLALIPEQLSPELKNRIYKQITVGCDYLVMTQEKAHELGFPSGAMSHDLLGHEKDVLPNDAMKAVIALDRAFWILPDEFEAKRSRYRDTAALTYSWLMERAKPLGSLGLSLFQRGLPEGTAIPKDEWQTRDLVTLCWASLEQWRNRNDKGKDAAIRFARQVMDRQIHRANAEGGFYGHFLEYGSMANSEKSWIHGIVNNQFGADIGGIYPNYLMPIIEMLRLWPEHEDAAQWKETLQQFTYGYLIPACERNPFLIVPQGIFGEEGPIWFCGTFHGTNAIYGYTAALALELSKIFNEQRLKEIAYGNLLWLAGLNAGITRENLKACVIFSADIPEGVALPASMMHGVGNRCAGTWFATRGVICNGFSTGKQFVYDTEPLRANDGPFSLTDEDWIPHSAAWLTGLARL